MHIKRLANKSWDNFQSLTPIMEKVKNGDQWADETSMPMNQWVQMGQVAQKMSELDLRSQPPAKNYIH